MKATVQQPAKITEANDSVIEGREASCAPAACSADVAKELARVRAEVKPTRRGVMIMADVMGQMLKLGWRKDQLDALEILFWSVRDADGRLKTPNDPDEPRGPKTTEP